VTAQGESDVQRQSSAIQTSLIFHASNSNAPVMSLAEVEAMTESSFQQTISNDLQRVTADEVDGELIGLFDDLAAGKTVSFASRLTGPPGHSMTEQYSMNVVLLYQRRPIGGILMVKVELVPPFCGLGSAIRPIAIRKTAEAVDNLEPDDLGEIVSRLSHQLGTDYAAK
jgi:hypothetical protein